MSKRPEGIETKHLEYLDKLRESGATNMLQAGSWIEEQFFMSQENASKVLHYWMDTFGKEDR